MTSIHLVYRKQSRDISCLFALQVCGAQLRQPGLRRRRDGYAGGHLLGPAALSRDRHLAARRPHHLPVRPEGLPRTHLRLRHRLTFLSRDAMHPRYEFPRGTNHGPMSVRPSQVGVLLKRLKESSWFLACEPPSTRPTLC